MSQVSSSAHIELDRGGGEKTFQQPLGDALLSAFLDGTVHWTMKDFMGDPERVALMMRDQHQPIVIPISINAYLIVTQGEVILVDSGFGDSDGPGTGKLMKTLEAAGFNADSIKAILLTHLHLDHADGVSEHGEVLFPNATVYVAQAEMDYWFNPKIAAAAPEHKKHGFKEAHAIDPYLKANKVVAIKEDGELLPCVTAISAPGHTPGHTAFLFNYAGNNLLHWGDVIHLQQLQFADPALFSSFDVDPEEGIVTRKRLMKLAADEKYLVASSHITFPGLGHVLPDGHGEFAWQPSVP